MQLTPGCVTLADLGAIYRGDGVLIDPACRQGVEKASEIVMTAASGAEPVYGVNTGFGKLASVRIPPGDTARLQRNLILSHAAGVGEPLSGAVVRLVLALKMLSLGRGASGARWQVIELLQAMLARGVMPLIPAQGSVGASGDLAPLAHMAAVMIGEGEADLQGARLSGAEALARAGLAPLTLGPKEGLALINGTQVTTALA
ncbi:MAG: aromatic amino acid lyase, partial [Paracoccaceae bacterium]